jgi:hypothetical protein
MAEAKVIREFHTTSEATSGIVVKILHGDALFLAPYGVIFLAA